MPSHANPLPPSIPDTLPDTRNLGVILRVLVAVNAIALFASVAAHFDLEQAWQHYRDQAMLLEPTLMLILISLAGLRDWLLRLSYVQARYLIISICIALSLGLRMLMGNFEPIGSGPPWRVALWSGLFSWGLLTYFRLRSRALSPLLTLARLQALQARIRPHFLFNSLNAVLSLIRSEPRRAEQALTDLADLFRVFMAENQALAPLRQEVELARQYLNLEKLRLGERLQVSWHCENMPADALIPPLTLQPLLENAVYHGIEPSISRGEISINIFHTRDEVHVDIRNPYFRDGGQHHAGNKMAMANIRERLLLHFDAEASLKTTVGSDYYQIHITLPYQRDATDARHAQNIFGR